MRKPILATGALIVGVLCAVPGAPAEQAEEARNEWRRLDASPGRSRYVPEPIRPPLRVDWQITVGRNTYPALGHGDRLFLQGSQAVRAVSTVNGNALWSWTDEGAGWFTVSAAVDPPPRLLGSTSSGLFALRPSNGRPALRRRGYFAWTAMADGTILAATDPTTRFTPQSLIGLNPTTGAVKWRRSLTFGYWTSFRDSETAKTVHAFRLGAIGEIDGAPGWIFALGRRTLVTLEPNTHRTRGLRYMDPYMVGGVAAGGGRLFALHVRTLAAGRADTELWCLNKQAMIVWRTTLTGSSSAYGKTKGEEYSALVITPTQVIVTGQKRVWALEREQGGIIWSTDISRIWSPLAGPVATGNVLHLITARGADRRSPAVVSLDLKTGRKLGSAKLPFWGEGSLLAHRGALYLRGSSTGAGKRRYVVAKLVPTRR